MDVNDGDRYNWADDDEDTTRLTEKELKLTDSIDLRGLVAEIDTLEDESLPTAIGESSFGRLIEALPIPGLLLDHEGVITFVNMSCRKICRNPDGLSDEHIASLFPSPKNADQCRALVRRVVQTRQTQVIEGLLYIQGAQIWARTHLRPVRLARQLVVLVLVEDLTLEMKRLRAQRKIRRDMELLVEERTRDLKAVNEQLRTEIIMRRKATEELEKAVKLSRDLRIESERANQAKSQFLARMSHELRTPLNAIIGFSEILRDQVYGPLNDRQSRYAEHVHSSGHHLLKLINDILDLAKVESGKMELALSDVNIQQTLWNATLMIKETAARHGICLELDVDEQAAAQTVKADEVKLKQILFNLLSNAAKFTPDGGNIRLSAKLNGDFLEISVTDTGIGLSPDNLESIFKEFEQADSIDGRKQQGTGLGLPLTRKLVELHGGVIHAESAGKDLGSTFRFTIPIHGRTRPKA